MKRCITFSVLAIALSGYCDSMSDQFSRELVEIRGSEMIYYDHLVCKKTNSHTDSDSTTYLVEASAPVDANISEDIFISRVVGITTRMLYRNINPEDTECVTTAKVSEPADITVSIQITLEGYSLTMSESGEVNYRHSAVWHHHHH